MSTLVDEAWASCVQGARQDGLALTLEELLQKIAEAESPTDTDKECRNSALLDVAQQLATVSATLGQTTKLGCEPYGSFLTGCFTSGSPLDIAITGSLSKDGQDVDVESTAATDRQHILELVFKTIRSAGIAVQGSERTSYENTLPFISFEHAATGVLVRLCMARPGLAFRSMALRSLIQLEPRLGSLLQLVELWADARAINQPAAGTFSPWALAQMAIFALQTFRPEPLLPPLWRLFAEYSQVGMPTQPAARPLQQQYMQSVSSKGLQPSLATMVERCGGVPQALGISGPKATRKVGLLQLFRWFLVVFDAVVQGWQFSWNRRWRVSTWHGQLWQQPFTRAYLMPIEDPFDPADNAAKSLGCEMQQKHQDVAKAVGAEIRTSLQVLMDTKQPSDLDRAMLVLFGLELEHLYLEEGEVEESPAGGATPIGTDVQNTPAASRPSPPAKAGVDAASPSAATPDGSSRSASRAQGAVINSPIAEVRARLVVLEANLAAHQQTAGSAHSSPAGKRSAASTKGRHARKPSDVSQLPQVLCSIDTGGPSVSDQAVAQPGSEACAAGVAPLPTAPEQEAAAVAALPLTHQPTEDASVLRHEAEGGTEAEEQQVLPVSYSAAPFTPARHGLADTHTAFMHLPNKPPAMTALQDLTNKDSTQHSGSCGAQSQSPTVRPSTAPLGRLSPKLRAQPLSPRRQALRAPSNFNPFEDIFSGLLHEAKQFFDTVAQSVTELGRDLGEFAATTVSNIKEALDEDLDLPTIMLRRQRKLKLQLLHRGGAHASQGSNCSSPDRPNSTELQDMSMPQQPVQQEEGSSTEEQQEGGPSGQQQQGLPVKGEEAQSSPKAQQQQGSPAKVQQQGSVAKAQLQQVLPVQEGGHAGQQAPSIGLEEPVETIAGSSMPCLADQNRTTDDTSDAPLLCREHPQAASLAAAHSAQEQGADMPAQGPGEHAPSSSCATAAASVPAKPKAAASRKPPRAAPAVAPSSSGGAAMARAAAVPAPAGPPASEPAGNASEPPGTVGSAAAKPDGASGSCGTAANPGPMPAETLVCQASCSSTGIQAGADTQTARQTVGTLTPQPEGAAAAPGTPQGRSTAEPPSQLRNPEVLQHAWSATLPASSKDPAAELAPCAPTAISSPSSTPVKAPQAVTPSKPPQPPVAMEHVVPPNSTGPQVALRVKSAAFRKGPVREAPHAAVVVEVPAVPTGPVRVELSSGNLQELADFLDRAAAHTTFDLQGCTFSGPLQHPAMRVAANDTTVLNGTIQLLPEQHIVVSGRQVQLTGVTIKELPSAVATPSLPPVPTAGGSSGGGAANKPALLVTKQSYAAGGSLTMRKCTIELAGRSHGLTAKGKGCAISMDDCTLTGTTAVAVTSHDAAITLTNSTLHQGVGSAAVGVCARDNGSLVAKDCRVSGYTGGAAAVLSGGSMELASCDLRGSSHGPGLLVEGKGSSAVARASMLMQHGHAGVYATLGGSCTLEGCKTMENQHGAAVGIRNGRIAATACEFSRNSEHGLVVMEGATVDLRDCELGANGGDGLLISGVGTMAVVRNCKALGNGASGVHVGAAGSLQMKGCVSSNSGSGHGLLVQGSGAKVSANSCTFECNAVAGVSVSGYGSAQLVACRMASNAGQVGVQVGDDGKVVLAVGCSWSEGHQGRGLLVSDKGSLEMQEQA